MANSNNSKKPWHNKVNVPQVNTQNKVVVNYELNPKHGYSGFKLYFPEEDTTNLKTILKNTSTFETYIRNNQDNFPLQKIVGQKFFTVDLTLLKRDEGFLSSWTNFPEEITTTTELCLSCMGLAMHQTIVNFSKEKHKSNIDAYVSQLPIIRVRIVNHEPIVQLKQLKVGYYGRLTSVRGTVIKAGNSKLLCTYMEFNCSYCGGSQVARQPDGVFATPKSCPSKGCNAHSNFEPVLSSVHTRTIHWRTIKLQELVGDAQCENGRVPRTLECELTEDLVNCCVPGDDVTLVGVLKARNTAEGNKFKQASVFLCYLDAVSIANDKSNTQSGPGSRITFSTKDYYAIKQIHSETMLFRLLVQSLCPTIFGHEIVKAGLLLALFGGTQQDASIRSDAHVLVVGDPGLGKSQMLKACTNAAPRGVYVCGNTSTSCGLTVTMTRESRGEYAFEAGALVLADQGCCCIDEFDKMPTQHACLLEAMEQQSISIAKAGVMCNLPTRVSILAAANPAGGHYNRAKTVSENLKISSPMLSRFDLIFILLDNSNAEHDNLLSEHIFALHNGLQKKYLGSSQASQVYATPRECVSLSDKLKIHPGEIVKQLPHVLLRKYIAYAQKYIHPQLNDGAKNMIKSFYFDLRNQYHQRDCIPISTRHLEALVRLTQARAKLELREVATAEDALDVVEIMRHSLVDIYTNELGVLDFSRSQNGVGMSGRTKTSRFLSVLQKKAEVNTQSIFGKEELMKAAIEIGVERDKFSAMIESLNVQGYLLMKGGGKYRLVTADFT